MYSVQLYRIRSPFSPTLMSSLTRTPSMHSRLSPLIPSTSHTPANLTYNHTTLHPFTTLLQRMDSPHPTLSQSPTANQAHMASPHHTASQHHQSSIRSMWTKERPVQSAARTLRWCPLRRRALRSGFGALFYFWSAGLAAGCLAWWTSATTCVMSAATAELSVTGTVLPAVPETVMISWFIFIPPLSWGI